MPGRVVFCGVALGACDVDGVMFIGDVCVCVLSFSCRRALSSVLLPRSRCLRLLVRCLRRLVLV